jgi:hypothetical protein
MKKCFIFFLFLCFRVFTHAQELYVFSEPATNMPANTITPKLAVVGGSREFRPAFYRYTPELMLGINKQLMVHAATSFSNMHYNYTYWEGVSIYSKYRFYSADGVHQHFRLAAFAEGAYSTSPLYYDELSLRGDNSGIAAGIIATQLKNKLAVSATTGFLKIFKPGSEHQHHEVADRALNYSLSAGYLVLPFEYKSYKQLNVNVYTEFLGQQTFGKKTYFIDAAPAIQFIFNSNSKLNLGYRFQLGGTANRSLEKSFLVSFEHTFFNAFKKG